MLRVRQCRYWLMICVVIASMGCCKRKLAIDEGGQVSPLASDDPGLEDSGESHRDSKIDRTIKCFNAAIRINKSANRYFERLQGGVPRAGRIPVIQFKRESTQQVCQDAKKDVTPPMPEIDRIMPRYVELVEALSKQLEQMADYYKSKAYGSDNFKKGKETHDAFKKGHEEFRGLHDALAEAIDEVTNKRDDESIERESKVKGLRYHFLVFLRDAKMFSREIAKDKPDIARFSALKAALDQSHGLLMKHALAHPEEIDRAFMFEMYKGRAEAFVESVRNVDANELRDRDLDNMLDKYNSMVDASNLVRWRP